MKRFVTHFHFFRFTNFSVAILFLMISFQGVQVNATTITTDPASNIKLTTATLGATISSVSIPLTERGIIWSTTPGVTITDHKISDAVTTGGTFTFDVSGFDKSRTIYFKGYYTDGNGTVLSNELSFSNVPVFQGTGNWDNASNWNVQEVPGIVPGDSPIIDGICTIATNSPNGNWVCGNLTINTGAVLTINPAQALNVTGTLTNNATVSGLVIKSDAINANGTLTFANGTPLATVEMYSKASWDLHQAVGSKYSWQFFGIPVTPVTLSNSAFANCLVRKYNESSPDDIGLWTTPNEGVSLVSGDGYEIVQQSPTIYTFTGQLTNADFTRSLNYTSGTVFPGQHIFSNPYTAAIDIKKIVFGANTEESIYLYNTGTYNQWLDNTAIPSDGTTGAPGQYIVTTPNTAGNFGVPTQIPGMQGFLMKSLNGASGSVSIPYLTAATGNTEAQRAPGIRNTLSDKVVTRIDLSGSHYADCMWIFTDPACTVNFDNGWDGYKIMGSAQSPQLYAMETAGDFQIDALADINETYLGFNAGADTDYKLTFTHKNTDTHYSDLYLVDLVENKTTDITASGSEYAFTATSTLTPVKRFKIITGSEMNTKTPVVSSLMKVFYSNGTLVIQNQSSQNGELVLYNLNGIAVKRVAYKANDITTISTSNLMPGAYVAKASNSREVVTERLIIR
ncbi:MAG: T9SS type A sorting domain-containing protein [Paludibacter sp.]|nr:T9SS type A sorting domain-containing protein [Paludibacter sp.]